MEDAVLNDVDKNNILLTKIIIIALSLLLAYLILPIPVHADETKVINPMMKQNMITLIKNNILVSSDPKNIKMTAYDSRKGIMISGEKDRVVGARFSINKVFDFGRNVIGRFQVDGLASKGQKIKLAFYLDDSKDPFTTVDLIQQYNKDYWTDSGDYSKDILSQKIKGEHRLSFKVISDSENQTFLLRSLEFVQNSLPVIYFNLNERMGTIAAMNADPTHEKSCYGDMTVQVPDSYRSEYTSKILSTKTYSMTKEKGGKIHGRGHSTWYYKKATKKPYKLHLDEKADLFGMGESKHWVLLANYFDNSMIHNECTYWLGDRLGMPYTSKMVPVEVVMNGKYLGAYDLCEHVRIGKNQVGIDDLEESDQSKSAIDGPMITGGYLISTRDHRVPISSFDKDDVHKFKTSRNNRFNIDSPAFEEYSNKAQRDYIMHYFQRTEDSVYGKNYRNNQGEKYSDLMDVDSAVDYYWVQEVSKNNDNFLTDSTYLYKPRSDKLHWGPLWDFDLRAWGDPQYGKKINTEGFIQMNHIWYDRLFDNKYFAKKVVDRWPAVKAKLYYMTKKGGQIDKYAAKLEVAAKYNKEKCGIYAPAGYCYSIASKMSYRQEVERYRNWIRARVKWINNNIDSIIPVYNNIKGIRAEKYSKQKLIILWEPSEKANGYQIVYKIDTKGKWKKKTLKSNRASIKISSGSIIKYKIRSFTNVERKQYYGNWTKIKRGFAQNISMITANKSYLNHIKIKCNKVKSSKGSVKYQYAVKKADSIWKYAKSSNTYKGYKIIYNVSYKYKIRAIVRIKNKNYFSPYSKTKNITIK